MKFLKYLTAFSVFGIVLGSGMPADAITFNLDPKTTPDGNLRGFGTIELQNLTNDGVLESEIDGWNITIEEVGNESNNFTLTSSNSSLNYGDDSGFLTTTGGVTEFRLDTNNSYVSIGFNSENGENDFFFGDFWNDGNPEADINLQGSFNGKDGNSDSSSTLIATNSTAVPFEAEGTMGLLALGGFFGYRYYKKRKQVLVQEHND